MSRRVRGRIRVAPLDSHPACTHCVAHALLTDSASRSLPRQMLVEALAVVAVLIVLAVTVLAVKLRAPPTFAPGPPKVCRTYRIVA